MKFFGRILRVLGWGFSVFLAVVLVYLGSARVGALVPRGVVAYAAEQVLEQGGGQEVRQHTVYLLIGSIHVDIALEVTPGLRKHFSFLENSSLPMDHENLQYLAFGWGSKAFYTTAGTYGDITLSAVAKAITGDDSVMRVTAFGDIAQLSNVIKLTLSDGQMKQLRHAIKASIAGSGEPQQMSGVSIGGSDAFYEAEGRFNIFHPCNQWAGSVLSQAGVGIGQWTPTTDAFQLSLKLHTGV